MSEIDEQRAERWARAMDPDVWALSDEMPAEEFKFTGLSLDASIRRARAAIALAHREAAERVAVPSADAVKLVEAVTEAFDLTGQAVVRYGFDSMEANRRAAKAKVAEAALLRHIAKSEAGGGVAGWCFDMALAPRDGSEVPLTDGADVFSGFWSKVENRRSWADRNGNWFAEMDRGNEETAKPVTVTAWRHWFDPPAASPRPPAVGTEKDGGSHGDGG